jgi:hypothetical protein
LPADGTPASDFRPPERVLVIEPARAKTGFTTPIGSWLQNLSLPVLAPPSRAGARPKPWARQWAERLAPV